MKHRHYLAAPAAALLFASALLPQEAPTVLGSTLGHTPASPVLHHTMPNFAHRYFTVPGKYIHGVSIFGNRVAWISEFVLKHGLVGDTLFTASTDRFQPHRIQTAKHATLAGVVLSREWVVWEAQSYDNGFAVTRKNRAIRHACGGGMANEPWAVYAQNIQTGRRLMVDSSVREEQRDINPDELSGLTVHGDTVGWISTRCLKSNKYHVCLRKRTQVKTMVLPSPRPNIVAQGPKFTSFSNAHRCDIGQISASGKGLIWLRNIGAQCRQNLAIEGTGRPAAARVSAKVAADGTTLLTAEANHRYLLTDQASIRHHEFTSGRSTLAVHNLATGRTLTLARGADSRMMCMANPVYLPCGHIPQLGSSLVVWTGGSRIETLWAADLKTGKRYRLGTSTLNMLEPWTISISGHQVAWPSYIGTHRNATPRIELATIPTA